MTASRRLLVMFLLVLVPALGGAKDLEIASVWTAAPVKVDGTADKWSALTAPLGDVPMVIGAQNDAAYLYLFLKTSDPRIMGQVGRFGLTIWPNGQGKFEKGFGLRFPLGTGRQGGQRGQFAQGGQAGQYGQPGQPGQSGQPLRRGRRVLVPQPTAVPGEAPAAATPQLPKEFEMIGPTENDRLRVPPAADQPVVAVLGGDASATVIELRIPLKATEGHPLAVGAAPGATVALGLMTDRPWGSRRPGGRGAEPPTPAGQPEGAATATSPGGATQPAAAGAEGGTTAAAPATAQGGATAAAPAGGQGRVATTGAPIFTRSSGRYGGNTQGGRDMTSAVNVWVKVSLAKMSAPSGKTPAPPAQAPAPKAGKPAPPAAAAAPSAKKQAAPAATPAPPKTQ